MDVEAETGRGRDRGRRKGSSRRDGTARTGKDGV